MSTLKRIATFTPSAPKRSLQFALSHEPCKAAVLLLKCSDECQGKRFFLSVKRARAALKSQREKSFIVLQIMPKKSGISKHRPSSISPIDKLTTGNLSWRLRLRPAQDGTTEH